MVNRFIINICTYNDVIKNNNSSALKLRTNHDWDVLVAKHAQICDRLGCDQETQRIATFITCLPPETAALARTHKGNVILAVCVIDWTSDLQVHGCL